MTDHAWVLLKSGRRLDLLDPDPDAWTDADLATGLARTYRWGGHSRWNLPFSVAQHSLLVLRIREQMEAPCQLEPWERLAELLHDADEGLLGFDAITPLKPQLGDGYAQVVTRLRQAIASRYGLRIDHAEGYERHRVADRLAAASEAHHVVGWSEEDIRSQLGILINPLHDDPLTPLPGLRAWEPWPPVPAAQQFLGLLTRLQAEVARPTAGRRLETDIRRRRLHAEQDAVGAGR